MTTTTARTYTVGDQVRILAPILNADRTAAAIPSGTIGVVESVPADPRFGIYGITLPGAPLPAGYQARELEPAATDTDPTALVVGQRVRTRIHFESASWALEQLDIPAGALGTITTIHHAFGDPALGVAGYGVLLDASVYRLAAWMDAADVEPIAV